MAQSEAGADNLRPYWSRGADVVPCFSYRYYLSETASWQGTKIFKTDGSNIVNYAAQQLENGRAKNARTSHAYKKSARILKRLENAMAQEDVFRDLPSYFLECLAYNCPDSTYAVTTWTEVVNGMLIHIWNGLQGDEPTYEPSRWLEVRAFTW
ncbi:MAG: hypothetical protein HYX63_00035 [Gammaproteobacteria bacterium]|nr:hypothetical protein [Gammaproteobacteria bacterium]